MNSSLHPLGKISKTHGYNGTLVLVSEQMFDDELENLAELFVVIDGLPVPFPIVALILQTDTSAHLQLEFVENQHDALELVGCEVYAAVTYKTVEAGLEQWIGFSVHDVSHGHIGVIRQIEDYHGNIVLQVMDKDKEILISLFPELVTHMDNHSKILYIAAPDGYFEES